MDYFVYILYSENLDRYYIGSTKEIGHRLKEHIWSHVGFTSRAKDWVLRYSEVHSTRSEAYAREKRIKAWKSRKLIEKLISTKS